MFPYIYHRFKPNVGKYSIHGAYGLCFFLQPLQSTQSMLPGRLVLSLFLSAFACDLFVETFLGSSGAWAFGKRPSKFDIFWMSPKKWMSTLVKMYISGFNMAIFRVSILKFGGVCSFFCFCMWVLTLNFCCRFWHHPGSVIIVLDQIEEGVTGRKTRMVVSIWSWNR